MENGWRLFLVFPIYDGKEIFKCIATMKNHRQPVSCASSRYRFRYFFCISRSEVAL